MSDRSQNGRNLKTCAPSRSWPCHGTVSSVNFGARTLSICAAPKGECLVFGIWQVFSTDDCLSFPPSKLWNQKGVMTFSEISITPSIASFLGKCLFCFEVHAFSYVTVLFCHHLLVSWSLCIHEVFDSSLTVILNYLPALKKEKKSHCNFYRDVFDFYPGHNQHKWLFTGCKHIPPLAS